MTRQYRLPAEWFRCDVCAHLFSKPRHRELLSDRISEPVWWLVGVALATSTWLSWRLDVSRIRHLMMPRHHPGLQHGMNAARPSR
jgi:hypothetical protein